MDKEEVEEVRRRFVKRLDEHPWLLDTVSPVERMLAREIVLECKGSTAKRRGDAPATSRG